MTTDMTDVIHVYDPDPYGDSALIKRGPYGPYLQVNNQGGYDCTTTSLRELLTWCLGPGREVLAQNGLVILGGSVAP